MGWSRSVRPGVPLPSQFVLLLQEAVICCEPALQFWLKMTVQNPIKAVHVPESFKYIHIFVSKRHLRVWELPGMPRAIAFICWCPQTGSSESSTDLTVFVCPESPGTERISREDGIALWGFLDERWPAAWFLSLFCRSETDLEEVAAAVYLKSSAFNC